MEDLALRGLTTVISIKLRFKYLTKSEAMHEYSVAVYMFPTFLGMSKEGAVFLSNSSLLCEIKAFSSSRFV